MFIFAGATPVHRKVKELRCIILANGDINDYNLMRSYIRDDDFVIVADGGIRHADKLGILADLIVGDLDSANQEFLEQQLNKGAHLLEYPRDKDEPDTELAIYEATKRNPVEIRILGATGSRLDHTLAAIHLLAPIVNKGISGEICDETHRITLVTPEYPVTMQSKEGQTFSLLPLTTTVQGVTTSGVKWPLDNAEFPLGKPYGISNVVTEEQAVISIKEGILILIEYKE